MLNPPKDLPKLDDSIVRQPEDIRRDLAEAASRNLFLFCRGVLGYADLTEDCHGSLCTWHDENPARFKLTLMPRGHLKTSCITIGKNMQKLVQNPEARVLIANETATNAQRFLSSIRTHAESNRRFRALYSHLIPSDPRQWSQEALTFVRQGVYASPTFDAIGMTGAMTSRHYTHLSLDDLISEEAAKSKLVMDDVITRISKLMSLMDNPSVDTVDITGTRWAFYDVYSYFMQRFGVKLARYIRAAIEDGGPIWPERFSLETLAEIRNDPHMGEYMFSCLYMNQPRNADVQDFNVQDLKFWRFATDEESIVLYGRDGEIEKVVELKDLDITTTVDVRYGEKLTSDRDAIVTCGTTDTGDAIVLDAWGERGNPLEVVAHLIWSIRRFHPRVIGIQKVGYEMSLKYHLQAECERQEVYAHVVPVKPGGPQKSHVRGLQPIAATGRLYVLPTQHILRSELAEFPLGQHDDVADALALQLQLWRGILSPERWRRYRESEARLLRRLDDYGLRAPVGRDAAGEYTPGELEDMGWDPENGRYSDFGEVTMP